MKLVMKHPLNVITSKVLRLQPELMREHSMNLPTVSADIRNDWYEDLECNSLERRTYPEKNCKQIPMEKAS